MGPNSPTHRILICRLSHLGDVCHALPLYHALRRAHPEAELGWVIQPAFADLIRGLPGLKQVFLFDRSGGLGAWPRLAKSMRDWGPDWTIDAQGNWKSALVTRLSGAPRRLGFHRRDWQEPSGAWAMTEYAERALGKHSIQRVQKLAEVVLTDCGEPKFHLPISPEATQSGAAYLATRLPDRGRPRRIVHPGCPGDRRSLPLDQVEGLVRGLVQGGEDVLLLSGPGEKSSGQELSQRLENLEAVQHWIDQRSLPQVTSLFAAAAGEGIRLVAGDSGPAHLAAAMNMGVDMWTGPTDPEATGPWPLISDPQSQHTAQRSPSGNISDLKGGELAQALLQPKPRP